MSGHRIHFIASSTGEAQEAAAAMRDRYGQAAVEDATVIVALGGDGFMLRALHQYLAAGLPVFGMKIGKVGFLMNRYEQDGLQGRLDNAWPVELSPLRMEAQTEAGIGVSAIASTAYNSSVRGPILPLGTEAMALTPISPFRPRRWSGAILPAKSRVRFEVLSHLKRPVSATADAFEVRDVIRVEVSYDTSNLLRLLFDPDHSLEERILNEQFL
jgi:NAD+ kinase